MVLDNASQTPSAIAIRAPASDRPERVEVLTRTPARRLARQVATYDEIVGESGLAAGGVWALERMARGLEVEGQENVVPEGPLLLVANHPGLADAIALFAAT